MKDLSYLGPVPPEESCLQVGAHNYTEQAAEAECRRYIELIRKVVGKEPNGVKLRVKWSDHDLGRYAEVVCEFDDKYPEAVDYALRCESEGPLTWDDDEDQGP